MTNISAGIRWLHYKKSYAKRILKREATWEETVIFYKGLNRQIGKGGRADGIITEIQDHYSRLQKLRKRK